MADQADINSLIQAVEIASEAMVGGGGGGGGVVMENVGGVISRAASRHTTPASTPVHSDTREEIIARQEHIEIEDGKNTMNEAYNLLGNAINAAGSDTTNPAAAAVDAARTIISSNVAANPDAAAAAAAAAAVGGGATQVAIANATAAAGLSINLDVIPSPSEIPSLVAAAGGGGGAAAAAVAQIAIRDPNALTINKVLGMLTVGLYRLGVVAHDASFEMLYRAILNAPDRVVAFLKTLAGLGLLYIAGPFVLEIILNAIMWGASTGFTIANLMGIKRLLIFMFSSTIITGSLLAYNKYATATIILGLINAKRMMKRHFNIIMQSIRRSSMAFMGGDLPVVTFADIRNDCIRVRRRSEKLTQAQIAQRETENFLQDQKLERLQRAIQQADDLIRAAVLRSATEPEIDRLKTQLDQAYLDFFKFGETLECGNRNARSDPKSLKWVEEKDKRGSGGGGGASHGGKLYTKKRHHMRTKRRLNKKSSKSRRSRK